MGGGSGSFFPRASSDLQRLIHKTKEEATRKQLDSDVNQYLRGILASYTRDPQKVNEYLETIADILKGKASMEQFLFGGSVAKHTYVDSLSDIDALVILDRTDLAGKSPQSILNSFNRLLNDKLLSDKVKSIQKGKLAVTVTYHDGTEIQLLPAIRTGPRVAIPNAGGKGWNETDPKVFQRTLTKANLRLNSALVPTIKLAKSIISDLPKQKRLTGYHIESLALESVKGYRGASTPKALLMNFFDKASKQVLKPVKDLTKQSSKVDAYLGKSNSVERRIAADALAGIARKLNSATSVGNWKSLLEE